MWAVGAAGSQKVRRQLSSLLDDPAMVWEHDIAGAFVKALFPKTIGIKELILLLKKVRVYIKLNTKSIKILKLKNKPNLIMC